MKKVRKELVRYYELRDQLMDHSMFVVVEDSPQWREFNHLSIKLATILLLTNPFKTLAKKHPIFSN